MIEFKHSFLRTGVTVTESKEYYKKADFSTINKVLKSLNIFAMYDVFYDRKDVSLPVLEDISVSCTNYGVFLKPIDTKYQTHIIEKFINSDSELQQKQDINLSFNDSISKYHGNTSDIEIENLIILSSNSKWKSYDWSLINRMVKKQNSFIKLHPILTGNDKQILANKFGKHKLIDSSYTADSLICNSKRIGIGASSETLITSNLLNKEIEFLNVKNTITKTLLYGIVYEGLKKGYHINELINSLVFNLIPWKYIHDETTIKNNIEFIREQYAECHKI